MTARLSASRPFLGLLLLGLSTALHAQDLPDPTRPPAVMSAPVGEVAVASGPSLQSVLIAPHEGGRRVAII
ncbi:MAG: MSHA biogenesis protein MshK, partial [Gammaproteobacteria bacterium]